jgi:hypothetical protein
MNIEIADNTKVATILKKYPAPRGATHFRFTAPGRKPVIDALKNIDVLAGCTGSLEYGKAKTEGTRKNRKIIGFIPAQNDAEKKRVPAPSPRPTTTSTSGPRHDLAG